MRWNFEAVEWNLLVTLTLVGGAAIAMADPALATEPVDDPAPVAEATDLPPAIRAIQDSLGGPLADRFDQMSEGELPETPWWRRFNRSRMTLVAPASAETATGTPGLKVAALRDAASRLDESANRLESLDLYPQADALREVAQRLRVDARRMAGDPENARGVAPGPAWGTAPQLYPTPADPGPTLRPEVVAPVPLISPVPTPAPESTPTRPDDGDADSDDGNGPTPAPTPARAE